MIIFLLVGMMAMDMISIYIYIYSTFSITSRIILPWRHRFDVSFLLSDLKVLLESTRKIPYDLNTALSLSFSLLMPIHHLTHDSLGWKAFRKASYTLFVSSLAKAPLAPPPPPEDTAAAAEEDEWEYRRAPFNLRTPIENPVMREYQC